MSKYILKSNNKKKDNYLIDIYGETVRYTYSMNIQHSKAILYNIDDLPQINLTNYPILGATLIEVCNEDTISMALRYCQNGITFKPLILNMCSKFVPGGGVKSGRVAQEEDIFRKTSAFLTHKYEWYPLKDNEVVYAPEIRILRGENNKILPENKQYDISMISVHAIKDPALNSLKYSKHDKQLMTAKIESIFKIGLIHGHDTLILGALGCGVYNNPKEEVLHIFNQMLAKYKQYFKKVGFAILSVGLSGKQNYQFFKKGV